MANTTPFAQNAGGDYRLSAMDLIRIDGLELRCIVGLRSYERKRQQPLSLDISLGLDLSSAGRSGRIIDTADYSRVADEITALLHFREYRLLEVAAEEAAALLFASHQPVQQVRIRMDKPEALAGRARSAAIEITRSRGAFGATEEPTFYGGKTTLLQEAEGAIELLRIAPGCEVELSDNARRLEVTRGKGSGDGGESAGPITYERGQVSHYSAGQLGLWICRCLVFADGSEGPADAGSSPPKVP